MSDRVLSTGTAKQAITRMQQIINSGLVEQIEQLNTQGQTLSDASVWDGQLADQFRSNWPSTYQALTKAKNELDELRRNIEKINQNIMQAGGNA